MLYAILEGPAERLRGSWGYGGKMRLSRLWVALLVLLAGALPVSPSFAAPYLLIPMDEVQSDHLRAYGLAYRVLERGEKVKWLLNYRGGSFLLPHSSETISDAAILGVALEDVGEGTWRHIRQVIERSNMDVMELEKAPKIGVYTPPGKEPWDDAVTLVLTYAHVPYETLWDREVLNGALEHLDWLHLHHEDFTGQYGKFYASFHNASWYLDKVRRYRKAALEAGFSSVQAHKCAVVKTIKEYVRRGGFLFAMCSACDTFDIALAADGIDIVAPQIDGTPVDPMAQSKLDFSKCLAFENFTIITNPYVYEYSDIDVSDYSNVRCPEKEDFVLFEFSAKFDPVETMLTQDHTRYIRGFFGQTTSFNEKVIKPGVRILGEIPGQNRAKYIHGDFGKGTFTFYGGHDPEDFSHAVGDPPTDLSLHKHSPGYRLILNNILFPAARKKKLKT